MMLLLASLALSTFFLGTATAFVSLQTPHESNTRLRLVRRDGFRDLLPPID
jgi:hypothetical protein